MNLDRLLFLSLASSLSAMACSAAPADSDADEGAVAGTQCVAPGADSARIVDSQATFCTDFAGRAASKGDHWASVYGQCMTSVSRYKSKAAEAAVACFKSKEGRESTWDTLYGCGYQALLASCVDDRLGSKCQDLVTVLGSSGTTQDGRTDRDAQITECKGYLSGLETSAVAEVERCVRADKYPIYSCVEGLDATKDRTCIDPGVHERVQGLAAQCDKLLTVSSAEEGILNRDTCLGIGTRLRAHPANAFLEGISALAASGKAVGNYDVTQVAGKVTRDTCHNADVDASCKAIVDGLKAGGVSNNGGRLTRECRQILSAIDAKGADQVRTCAGFQQRVGRSSGGGATDISLYWCMSDLKASPSEL